MNHLAHSCLISSTNPLAGPLAQSSDPDALAGRLGLPESKLFVRQWVDDEGSCVYQL